METYEITGRKFSDTPEFASWDHKHEFPRYTCVDTKKWTVDAENLTDAKIWLMKNHPSYYMGSNITCTSENESALFAAPCSEYPAGTFENNSNRCFYVQCILHKTYIQNPCPLDKIYDDLDIIYRVYATKNDKLAFQTAIPSISEKDGLIDKVGVIWNDKVTITEPNGQIIKSDVSLKHAKIPSDVRITTGASYEEDARARWENAYSICADEVIGLTYDEWEKR